MLNQKITKKSVKTNCTNMNDLIVQDKFSTRYFINHFFCISECISVFKYTINYNLKVDVVYNYIANYTC